MHDVAPVVVHHRPVVTGKIVLADHEIRIVIETDDRKAGTKTCQDPQTHAPIACIVDAIVALRREGGIYEEVSTGKLTFLNDNGTLGKAVDFPQTVERSSSYAAAKAADDALGK